MNISIFLLRVFMGWVMFYAGITKVLDSRWSAEGFLNNAKTFPEFYAWFAQPDILPIVNLINEWGLTLLGISLIFGIFVRLSSYLGVILMLLYYFPGLSFPYADGASYIIDSHIIYAAVLFFFAKANLGIFWGVDGMISKNGIMQKKPQIKKGLL